MDISKTPKPPDRVLWVNHFALMSVDEDIVTTSYSGNYDALVIMSSTTGNTLPDSGGKCVKMAVGVLPLGTVRVTGVRVCYELSNPRSYIDMIGLAQIQDPPGTALVMLQDTTPLTATGPVCVSTRPATTLLHGPIDPNAGSLELSLRVNFGGTIDKIAIRALGLILSGVE
jgi:hypothetical protein